MSVTYVTCFMSEDLSAFLRLIVEAHEYGPDERERSLYVLVFSKCIVLFVCELRLAAESAYSGCVVCDQSSDMNPTNVYKMVRINFMSIDLPVIWADDSGFIASLL